VLNLIPIFVCALSEPAGKMLSHACPTVGFPVSCRIILSTIKSSAHRLMVMSGVPLEISTVEASVCFAMERAERLCAKALLLEKIRGPASMALPVV